MTFSRLSVNEKGRAKIARPFFNKEEGMKFFRVTARSMNLNSGVVRLTGQQAQSRQHCLDLIGGFDKKTGVADYLITAPIQFKQDEMFWFDGEVNKATAREVEVLAEKASPAAAPMEWKPDEMNKIQIVLYAIKNLGLTLSSRSSKTELIKAVEVAKEEGK